MPDRAMLAQTYARLVNRRDEVMNCTVMICAAMTRTGMTRVASLVAGDHVRDGGSRIPCCAGENHI
jgi:hypothetical protein